MPDLTQINSEILDTASALSKLNDAVGSSIPGWNQLAEVQDKAKRSLMLYENALGKNGKSLKLNISDQKKLKGAYANAVKDLKLLTDHSKKYTDGIKNQIKGNKDLSSTMGHLKGGIGGVVGGLTKMGAMIGVGAIGFKEILGAAMDYNSSLTQLSQAQDISAEGVGDIEKALGSLNGVMVESHSAFAKLATEMTNAFIGMPPGIENFKKLSEAVSGQSLSTDQYAKSMRQLNSLQEKARPVYDIQIKKLDILANARKANRNLTEAEQKQIESLNGSQRRLGRAYGVGASEMSELRQQTVELNGAQKLQQKQAQTLLNAQKAQKKAMADLGNVALPIFTAMAKGATKFLEYISENKEMVMKVVGAFVALQALKPFVGLAKGAWGLSKGIGAAVSAAGKFGGAGLGGMLKFGGAVVAAGAAGYTLGKVLDKVFGISDKISQQKWMQSIVKFVDFMNGKEMLSDSEADKFAELGKAAKKARMDAAAASKIENKDTGVKDQERDYEGIVLQVQNRLKLLQEQTGLQQQQIAYAKEFGLVEKESYTGAISLLKEQASETKKLVESRLQSLKGLGVDFEFNADMSAFDQVQTAIDKIRDSMKGMNKEEADYQEKYADKEALINELSGKQLEYREKQRDATKMSFQLAKAEVDQMEQMTSKAEARLDAERKLMESAQFGMGASVEMMKKQVDLAAQMKEGYKDGQVEVAKTAMTLGNVDEEQIKIIADARTAGEAQQYITKTLGKSGEEASVLMQAYGDIQDLKTKELQQQQKIYDLTKDVREGYLDAIREMGVGAGEFSKIIGTQDKGVTQLMKAVKDVTGEDRLNTMALGGITARGAGSGRRGVTGRFGTGGVSFIGGKEQEQRNKDIYNYDRSYNAGTTVGSGTVVGQRPEMAAALRAGDKGGKKNRTANDAVNVGLQKMGSDSTFRDKAMKNAIREDGTLDYAKYRASVEKFSADRANAAKGSSPANVEPISPGTAYSHGKSSVKIEVTLVPTGELSNMLAATTEVIEGVAGF